MSIDIHTDLAIEASALDEIIKSGKTKEGVEVNKKTLNYLNITSVKLKSDNSIDLFGKPKGSYITIESPKINSYIPDAIKETKTALSYELKKMLDLKKDAPILIVGLGNRFVTADSIGPKVIDNILVTRHLFNVLDKSISDNMYSVCAVSPGVLGITGIETSEIIESLCAKIKPSQIIVIDALCAKSVHRLNTTFQLSDTGITPGSGIGNSRKALNEETLGVKVISIGVPTVIKGTTIACDIIDKTISDNTPIAKNKILNEVLYNNDDLIVTPTGIDTISSEVSKIISSSINFAINGEIAVLLGETI